MTKRSIAFIFLLFIAPFETAVAQDAKDPYDPASPEYQRLAELARKRREEIDRFTAPIRAASKERADYYQALRNQYDARGFPPLTDSDYSFLNEIQSIINHPGFDGDAELERDRIFEAAFLANNLHQPIDVVYQNLDVFRERLAKITSVKKTAIQTVIDSIAVYGNTPVAVGIGTAVFFIISILIIFIQERNKKQPVKPPKIKPVKFPRVNFMDGK